MFYYIFIYFNDVLTTEVSKVEEKIKTLLFSGKFHRIK